MKRIFFLSVLILYLEMLLIRWLGTEIRVFAYLQNGLLVAAFLGLGLGLRYSRGPAPFLPSAVALTLVGLVIKDPMGWSLAEALTQGLTAFQDSVIWAGRWRLSSVDLRMLRTPLVTFALAGTLALLWAVVLAFRPLGQWLGRLIDAQTRPITAYTANILGSLAGIALFTFATAQSAPPVVWLAVAGLGLAAVAWTGEGSRLSRLVAATLCLCLPLFAWAPEQGKVIWSPYQKLAIHPGEPVRGPGARAACGDEIVVNGTFYQSIVNLDPAEHLARPALYPPDELRRSHYILPYEVIGSRERVLVVGAGTGNDVAAALRADAASVHAVEIDPDIVRFGRERHPNHPYDSDKVHLTIDDARAFFRRDPGTYDVVWFGLLDSHTTPSAFTNIRLDHFVYTRESLADVKRLLAPSGVVVLYFWAEAPWIGDRLANLLNETFGSPPVSFFVKGSTACLGHGGLLLIGGREPVLAEVRRRAEADADIAPSLLPPNVWPLTAQVTTDDWPYLYLEHPSLPTYHWLVAAACLALAVLLRRRLFQPGDPVEPTMLLLGAGFMLLEVSGVSRAALLFGTTWTVNAYIVGGIMAMTLIANRVASTRVIDPVGWPFGGLVATLIALAFLPASWLIALSPWPRIVLGGAFLTAPVFFSGLIFVTVWSRSPRKDLALGSNILGALLGGIASMLSLLVGFRALTVLTLALYLVARFAIGRERREPGRSEASPIG